MAVLRNNYDAVAGNNNVILIGTIGGFLCLIVAVLGIKLKWFKHRLTFDEIATATPTPSPRSSRQDADEPQILNATFRGSEEFDNIVEITPPKILPPVRIPRSRTSNVILMPPKKRQAPEVPTFTITDDLNVNDTKTYTTTIPPKNDNLPDLVDNRHTLKVEHERSVTPPPLPSSPPPTQDETKIFILPQTTPKQDTTAVSIKASDGHKPIAKNRGKSAAPPPPPPYQLDDPHKSNQHVENSVRKKIIQDDPIMMVQPINQESKKLSSTQIQELSSQPTNQNNRISFITKGMDQSKKQSFLYQVQQPSEMPRLSLLSSLPNLAAQHPIDQTIQSMSSTPTINKLENRKTGFFSNLFSSPAKENVDSLKKEKQKVRKIRVLKEPKPQKQQKMAETGQSSQDAGKNKKSTNEVLPKMDSKKNRKPQENFLAESAKKNGKFENRQEAAEMNVDRTNDNGKSQNASSDGAFLKMSLKKNKNSNESSEKNLTLENKKSEQTNQKLKKDEKSPKSKSKKNYVEVSQQNENLNHTKTEESSKNKSRKEPTKEAKIETLNRRAVVENSPQTFKKHPKLKSTKNPQILENTNLDKELVMSNAELEQHSKPKKRVVLNLEGIDNVRSSTSPPKSPSSPKSDEEVDSWNLVARHRQNTQAIAMSQEAAKRSSKFARIKAEDLQPAKIMQSKQIDLIQKPKTMREMRREQLESMLLLADQPNDADRKVDDGSFKLMGKSKDEESDTEA